MAPQKGRCTAPSLILGDFEGIVAMSSCLGTLNGHYMYTKLNSRKTFLKVWRYSCHLWRCTYHKKCFSGFSHSKCLEVCRSSRFSLRMCILIRCANLHYLKWNRLGIIPIQGALNTWNLGCVCNFAHSIQLLSHWW